MLLRILIQTVKYVVNEWPGICLSVCSSVVIEAMGMLFVAFVLDRLAKQREKRREQQRWLPLRVRLYARMLAMADEFLDKTVPEPFREDVAKTYYYDAEYPVACGTDVEVKTDLQKHPLSLVIDDILMTGAKTAKADYILAINKVRDEINKILDKFAAVLEPEALRLVWDLQHTLEELTLLDGLDQDEFSFELAGFILRMIGLRDWAAGKATREELVPLGKHVFTREHLASTPSEVGSKQNKPTDPA